MRLAEISHRSVKAGVQARLRLPAQDLLDLPSVHHRTPLLPREGRAVLLLLVTAGETLQQLEDRRDVGLDAGADVE
jgi:hypothetical protein